MATPGVSRDWPGPGPRSGPLVPATPAQAQPRTPTHPIPPERTLQTGALEPHVTAGPAPLRAGQGSTPVGRPELGVGTWRHAWSGAHPHLEGPSSVPPEVGGSFRSPALGRGRGGALRHHTHPSQTLAPHPATRKGTTPPEPRMPRPAHLPPRLQMRRQLPWVGWVLGDAQGRASLLLLPPGTPSPQPRPPQCPRVSSIGRALPPSQLIPRKGLQDPQGRGIPRQHHLSPTAQITLTGPHSQDQGQEGCRLTACASTPPSPGPRPRCGSGHPRQETRRPGPEPLGAPGAQRAGSPHPRPATRESSPAWHLSPSKPPSAGRWLPHPELHGRSESPAPGETAG